MMLINSLLSNADDDRWQEFIDELERLNVRKAVVVRPSPSLVHVSEAQRFSTAPDVLAHNRGPHVINPGFPGEHDPSHIQAQDPSRGS
jgi:hypothetical protein